MNRRRFLGVLLGSAAIGLAMKGQAMAFLGGKKKDKKEFAFKLSEAEWKEKLSPEAYHVMREEGTERARTSPLNDEKRKGTFHCKGCDWPLYSSDAKYESATGWPSFYAPIDENAVGLSKDYKLFYSRTEVHCANCGSHLGHVFDDGPEPTGKRYCMNGVAMVFKPQESE